MLIILYNQYIRKIFFLSVLVINSDLDRLTESYFHQTETKKGVCLPVAATLRNE